MTGTDKVALPALDADSLKLRFKKRCVETNNVHQNWQIRVHRALSWLKRATEFDEQHAEARFLFLWIALNSLYSRWNNQKNAPDFDSAARNDFIAAVCEMDLAQVAEKLHRHRGLVKKILSNPFLSEVFWRAPDHPMARGRATEDAGYIDLNFKQRNYCKVLTQAMQRLFVLRGQIVHGASTGGSRLNRSSLRHCLELLAMFVPVVLHIVIDKGCGDDWPELCYPPQK